MKYHWTFISLLDEFIKMLDEYSICVNWFKNAEMWSWYLFYYYFIYLFNVNDQDEIFFGFLTCSFIENLSFLITEKKPWNDHLLEWKSTNILKGRNKPEMK